MTTIIKLDSSSQESSETMEIAANKISGLAENDKTVVVMEAPTETGKRLERIINYLNPAMEDSLDFLIDEGGEFLEPEYVFERQLKLADSSCSCEIGEHLKRYSRNVKLLMEINKDADLYKNSEGGNPRLAVRSLLRSYPKRMQAIVFSALLEESGLSQRRLDFEDVEFPVQLHGDTFSSYPNLEKSRHMAGKIDWTGTDVYVIPGFGTEEGLVKNIGLGSAETAAFTCVYAFSGENCYICTDSPGIRKGPFTNAGVLDCIDTEEARFAGLLNAKLHRPNSLNPVLASYEETERFPDIYITNIEELGNSGTKMVIEPGQDFVKFMGSRHITTFHLSGPGYGSLQREMDKHGVDNFTYGSGWGHVRIGIVEGEIQANDIIGKFRVTGQLNLEDYNDDACILGVVGRRMDMRSGISHRTYSTLAENDINVIDGCDMSRYFAGVIISHNDQELANRVVYNEFFN